MATYTDNLNLIKPAQGENYNIDVANTNNEIIDNAVGNKQDKVAGKGLSTNDFTTEYKRKIDGLQKIYKYKGSVTNYSDLESITDKNNGDVWNVTSENKDYAWNVTEWTLLGTNVDLSDYITEEAMNDTISPIAEDLEQLDGKVTQLSGEVTQLNRDVSQAQRDISTINNNIVINKSKATTTEEISENTDYTIPLYYKVGADVLDIYYMGEKLMKGTHYIEVGNDGTVSNKIQFYNWGQAVPAGRTIEFIVRGVYS